MNLPRQLLDVALAAPFVAGATAFLVVFLVTVRGAVWLRRVTLGAALGGAVALGALIATRISPRNLRLGEAVVASTLAAAIALTAWALGLLRRARKGTAESLRDKAARLERERDSQAQIAAAAERARIAREMHDIVAHSLSVMIAQADGGRYAAAGEDSKEGAAAAARSLEVIADTGRAALADMRRLLGVLRTDEDEAPTSPIAPVDAGPDDADLAALVETARASGMRVALTRLGEPRRLPPGMGLTLHRVAQEALTNVRKHAGADATVSVAIRWSATSVVLEVTDDGYGAAAGEGDDPGFGVTGMRERVAMFAGTLDAGPQPGGGWKVRCHLPLPATSNGG